MDDATQVFKILQFQTLLLKDIYKVHFEFRSAEPFLLLYYYEQGGLPVEFRDAPSAGLSH